MQNECIKYKNKINRINMKKDYINNDQDNEIELLHNYKKNQFI